MIPLLILFIIWRFVFKRFGPASSIMTFGKSKGRLYAQEDLNVTFDDVAGIDEAKEELQEIVEFLKTPEKFRALGGKIPKGVLLVGAREQEKHSWQRPLQARLEYRSLI